MLRYTTDRARPGLVTYYDIWSGNGVGLFLQPQKPHGVHRSSEIRTKHREISCQQTDTDKQTHKPTQLYNLRNRVIQKQLRARICLH